jgi:general secretion pathway protein J
MRRHAQRGVTLVELVVSIAIVAVITLFSFMTIQGATEVAEETAARAELYKMGRNAMEKMSAELTMAFISNQRSEFFQTHFVGTDRDPVDEVYFVARAHEKRYAEVKEADYAEFHYWSEDDMHGGRYRTLMHRESPVVDDDPERGGTVHALCHDVRELNLRWFDSDREEWVDEWDSESSDYAGKRPSAFEIRLELEDSEGREAAFFTRARMKP